MKTRFFNLSALVVSISLLALSGTPKLAVSAHPLSALAPTVTNVLPTQAYNYQATTITISGTNFVATPTVLLGNVSLTNVTFVNDTTLTATVPADLPGGAYTLTVTNLDSQSVSLASAFTVLLGGDGNLSTWQTTSSMTTPRSELAAVAQGTYLYALGGTNGPSLSSVERAQINDDGTLSSWQVVSPMTTARQGFAAVVAGGYLYALGGYNGSFLSSVERAQINADGTLGFWQVVSPMTTPRWYLAAVVAGGYLYALGGTNGSSLSSVERAQINADGTLGSWQVVSSMTLDRYLFSAVTVGGYLYALGGFGYNGTSNLSSVERAVINADGTLGPWQIISSMNSAKRGLAAVSVGGYLYTLGGNAANCISTVERAVVNADGTLGSWQVITPMPTARWFLATATVGRNLYALGGNDCSSNLRNVEWAAINPPSLAAFSPLAVPSDSSTNVTITGANLRPTPSLRLGDSTTLTSSFVSTTTVSATIPSGLANGWYSATVTSGDGRVATLANALRVDGPGPVVVGDLGVTINDGALFTNQVTVTLTIGSITNTALMQVSNDGGFAGAPWETYTSHKTWQITQYGSYVLPRVVYVRYKDLNGNVSATYQDDIILDLTPPVGTVSIIGATGLQAMASTVTLGLQAMASIVTLGLSATDDVSGVGQMLISNQPDFFGAIWESYATSRAWALGSNGTVYVRYRDNAGNVSTTYTASSPSYWSVFLPLILK